MSEPLRAMMIGAHPDDVDICTCGITKRLVSKGCIVRFVSMTTGNAGHQTMRGEELIKTRAAEAQKSAAYLGATYEILPFDDGRLTPSLEARETLMRTIRNFKPDVIFTNRACDYHPDHRATGQLVQDCSYLMGVPAICRIPPCAQNADHSLLGQTASPTPKTVPLRFRPPADDDRETLFHVECCHASQFLDWLPWADDHVDLAGKTHEERVEYLRSTFTGTAATWTRTCSRASPASTAQNLQKTFALPKAGRVSEYGSACFRGAQRAAHRLRLSRIFPRSPRKQDQRIENENFKPESSCRETAEPL